MLDTVGRPPAAGINIQLYSQENRAYPLRVIRSRTRRSSVAFHSVSTVTEQRFEIVTLDTARREKGCDQYLPFGFKTVGKWRRDAVGFMQIG